MMMMMMMMMIASNNLYNETQSGLRKGYSTVTPLLKLRDDIKQKGQTMKSCDRL